MYVNAKVELVTLAPGLRPERRSAPLARGLCVFRSFIEVKFVIFEPRESKFSISLASIPNDENMRFGQAIFIRLNLLRFAQNGTKTCHSTAKTVLFMTMENYVHTQ